MGLASATEVEAVMNHNLDNLERESGIPAHPQGAALAASLATGAATGALIGFFAGGGSWSAIIGSVIGAATGGGIGKYVHERSKREHAKDEILDREIGVIDGNIGAGPLSR